MKNKPINTLPKSLKVLVCVALFGFAGHTLAAQNSTITDAQRQMAAASKGGVDLQLLAANAPGSYTVKAGDTLWKIAGVFLKSPWRWPALWGLNLTEIHNPHMIYPGEVLNLEISDGKARLSRGGMSSQEVRLSPSIRVSDQISTAIPTIAYSSISPFLTKPVMVDDEMFKNSGVVFAAKDSRLNIGAGGRMYATGIPAEASVGDTFSLYRPGRSVNDPDAADPKTASALLGVEAVFLGEARLVSKLREEGVATLDVTNAVQEIGRGDRLLSMPKESIFQYAPHATQSSVRGRVVMMHDGRTGTSLLAGAQQSRSYETEGGPLSILVINRGANDGLERGHVLELMRPSKVIEDRGTFGFSNGDKLAGPRTMPSEKYGTVMVFKTFSKIAYAIVMDASTSVLPGDDVVSTDEK